MKITVLTNHRLASGLRPGLGLRLGIRLNTLRRGEVGLALSGIIAMVGARRGALSSSGAAGAVATGTITTAAGGYSRAALLVAFFASSSAMDRLLAPTRHNAPEDMVAARSERRDIVQVLANGGVAVGLAIAGGTDRHALPYLGALAAVTGDTWATEIGSRSQAMPRQLLTGRPVPAGTSGGVTLPGSLASIAGGAFIGAIGAIAFNMTSDSRTTASRTIIAGTLAGTLGSLADSVLGATLQERRWCPECRRPTEQPVHRCGTPTRVTGGIPGITNDVVNVACSLTGALVGYVVERTGSRNGGIR